MNGRDKRKRAKMNRIKNSRNPIRQLQVVIGRFGHKIDRGSFDRAAAHLEEKVVNASN